MTTLPHPYLHVKDDLPIPEDKVKDVEEFYEWIQSQKHFPNYSKNHAHQFLHACFWEMSAAKTAIRKYGELRAEWPDVFGNRDSLIPEIKSIFDNTSMAALPNLTPEGYRIIVYKIINPDTSVFDFVQVLKAFCMFNDAQLSIDGILNGYIVIFDMQGFGFGHFMKFKISHLKMYMQYIQEAHPIRLRGVYVIHTSWFINHIMNLLKPLIRSDMFSILHFSTNGPLDFFEPDCLTKDYGGDLKPTDEYREQQRLVLETDYRDWLIDSGNLKDTLNDDSSPKKSWGGWFSS